MDEASTLPPFEMIDGPMEPIDRIIAWQKDIGADKPDDVMAIKHLGYILEEAAEGCEFVSSNEKGSFGLPCVLYIDSENSSLLEVSRQLKQGKFTEIESRIDLADAFTDALVFAIGGLMRLGLDPKKCIETVAISLDSKRLPDGTFDRDVHGKIKKPATFVEPDWSWIRDN